MFREEGLMSRKRLLQSSSCGGRQRPTNNALLYAPAFHSCRSGLIPTA